MATHTNWILSSHLGHLMICPSWNVVCCSIFLETGSVFLVFSFRIFAFQAICLRFLEYADGTITIRYTLKK